jgi:cell division protein FtsI (penicillin-binding protein 3)
MEKWSAKGAWAVIQEVKTGRILALANRPAFNPNEYGAAPDPHHLNSAIGYVYEPGSTFKVATIAAALNERVTTPHTIFDCENGRWHYAGRILRDYHPHGRLSVGDVLKVSSNIGAAKVAMLLGEERLYRYLTDFGFGRKTGVDLPGEEGGILPPVKRWSKLSISRIPMGQGISVTSLQMMNLLCCMANDGNLMRPLVIDRIVTMSGDIVAKPQPYVMSRPISPETAHLMRKLLTRVTEDGGTGTKAVVDGFTVGGKTGSAQKVIDKHYSESASIASFMGFLPAERPEIAIMVVVDEPQPLHTGGMVAAPVFKEIAEKAVHYLDIPPVPEEQVYRFGDEIPSFEG